ncbi:MAG: zinc metallopeptidase [Chloroflexi bacterium]|nr:zinc metallopeptidase [Chloroflexota bacterium]
MYGSHSGYLLYYIFTLPALLLGLYAQWKVKSAYKKWSKVRNQRNITGAQAAEHLLVYSGMQNVGMQTTRGTLSDHYDPRSKQLFLSEGVAQSPSVAALGIVAHEVGHAQQDASGYTPMKLRSAIVPAVQIGSWVGPIIFIAGLVLSMTPLTWVGLALFSCTVLFSLVTLPVELNASNRAVEMLTASGAIVGEEERQGVRSVLTAAALTYVAVAIQSILTLLYYFFLIFGRRRR